jgi:hypothetical protein
MLRAKRFFLQQALRATDQNDSPDSGFQDATPSSVGFVRAAFSSVRRRRRSTRTLTNFRGEISVSDIRIKQQA